MIECLLRSCTGRRHELCASAPCQIQSEINRGRHSQIDKAGGYAHPEAMTRALLDLQLDDRASTPLSIASCGPSLIVADKMTGNSELDTMLSIFALSAQSPQRQKTLEGIVNRYRVLANGTGPHERSGELMDEQAQSVYEAMQRGFRKISMAFKDSPEMHRLAKAASQEGTLVELDPEAYVFLANRCLAMSGGTPASKLSGRWVVQNAY